MLAAVDVTNDKNWWIGGDLSRMTQIGIYAKLEFSIIISNFWALVYKRLFYENTYLINKNLFYLIT